MISEETVMDVESTNRAAEFLPQVGEDERPALRVGGALVFAYVVEDGAGNPVLRVSVDLDEAVSPQWSMWPGVEIVVQGETVWEA